MRRRTLALVAMFAILGVTAPVAGAHDGGSVQHKDGYLRALVVKVSGKKSAPGCDLVEKECPKGTKTTIAQYFHTLRVMGGLIKPPPPPVVSTATTSSTPVAAGSGGGGDTYCGLLQFNQETWESVGGSGSPCNASPAEQMARGEELRKRRGTQPWPVCGQNGASMEAIVQCESGGDPHAVG